MNPEEEAEEDGANIDLDSQRKGKCVVLKTSTRQVSYSFSLPSVCLSAWKGTFVKVQLFIINNLIS